MANKRENRVWIRILQRSVMTLTFDLETWFKASAHPIPTCCLLVKSGQDWAKERKIWPQQGFFCRDLLPTLFTFDLETWFYVTEHHLELPSSILHMEYNMYRYAPNGQERERKYAPDNCCPRNKLTG